MGRKKDTFNVSQKYPFQMIYTCTSHLLQTSIFVINFKKINIALVIFRWAFLIIEVSFCPAGIVFPNCRRTISNVVPFRHWVIESLKAGVYLSSRNQCQCHIYSCLIEPLVAIYKCLFRKTLFV